MIDIQLYRMRIGCFSARRCKQRCAGNSIWVLLLQCLMIMIKLLLTCAFLISLGMLTLAVIVGVTNDFSSLVVPYAHYSFICRHYFFVNPFLLLPNIFAHYVSKLMFASFFSSSIYSCIINRVHRGSRSKRVSSGAVSYTTMITALVNFLIIAIFNPSLLNPGPSSLTVLYQNVQSFLLPYSAGKTNPDLDRKKVSNFQGHVAFTKPDIIVLNETWLKSSINSNVLLSDTQYKVYRRDRS